MDCLAHSLVTTLCYPRSYTFTVELQNALAVSCMHLFFTCGYFRYRWNIWYIRNVFLDLTCGNCLLTWNSLWNYARLIRVYTHFLLYFGESSDRPSPSQGIPYILWNLKVVYCIHKSLLLICILSQMHAVHILSSIYLINMNFEFWFSHSDMHILCDKV